MHFGFAFGLAVVPGRELPLFFRRKGLPAVSRESQSLMRRSPITVPETPLAHSAGHPLWVSILAIFSLLLAITTPPQLYSTRSGSRRFCSSSTRDLFSKTREILNRYEVEDRPPAYPARAFHQYPCARRPYPAVRTAQYR